MFNFKNTLLIIVVVAIFSRLFLLDKNPPSLFADEVDLGYQAYSFLLTGKDYHGNILPVHFQSFADFRTPLYIYLTVPFVAVLGLNEWSIRLPAAIFGVAGVVGIFFLTEYLFKNRYISLLAGLLLSLSPWHLQYSRAGFEVTLMLTLVIWGLYFLLAKSLFFKTAGLVFFILALYSYSTAKLFIPLFILCLIILFKITLNNQIKRFLIPLLVLIVLITPFIWDLRNSLYRFSYTSIFSDPTISTEIDYARQADNGLKDKVIGTSPQFLSVLTHNKPLSLIENFGRNYISAFSTDFLFLNGDRIGRHSVGKMGELYVFEMITIIFGIWGMLRMNNQIRMLLVSWILLAPVASSLTVEGANHATRLILLLPPLVIISANGFYLLWIALSRNSWSKMLLVVFCFFAFFNVYIYFHRYYTHYPIEKEVIWHYGYKQVIEEINKHSSADKVLFTTSVENPLIFILFWNAINPNEFIREVKKEDVVDLGTGVTRLRNYYLTSFNLDNLNKDFLTKNTIIIASRKDTKVDFRKDTTEGYKLVKTVEYPSGEVAFYVLQSKN